jgi:nicotinate-nucleotide adenylyltransferase
VSLGILGGTFNPIHCAHLRLAEVARAELALTRVLFVPAGDPPLKHSDVAPAHHRLAMLRLALSDRTDCEVLDVELTRPGPSYTVDTLALLRERHPEERRWFIVGADALAQLEQWRSPERLFELASFAAARRPGSPGGLAELLPQRLARAFRKRDARTWVHTSGSELRELPFPPLDVSATQIRARAARGENIECWVAPRVAAYIAEHELYREAA